MDRQDKDTMSLAHKSTHELIQLTKRFIPPLLPEFHKGQAGRIAVIGGCEDYTGAPFFSAHAAALMGCDLTHVICEKLAAPVIKSYSPDLMVHPYLFEKANVPQGYDEDEFLAQKIIPKVESLLSRIHVVVVGPGFGRDPLMLKSLEIIIEKLIEKDIPIILDADSIYLISQNPGLIKDYHKAIITPNVVEFQRICKAVGVDPKANTPSDTESATKLSKALGNVTILQKGAVDIIANGDKYIVRDDESTKGSSSRDSSAQGSLKRVGGQGDSLTGCIATLVAWGFGSYRQKLWPQAEQESSQLSDAEILMLSCFSAGQVVRLSAAKAFEVKHRAMQTSDIHAYIGESYRELFE